ncbi:hypothetical protein DRQ07_01415 [candidate division KSB1 bacterium]|nr:MAG: hypothetical protein DRQ07_01415 [candidate division KSB1 bacterium]
MKIGDGDIIIVLKSEKGQLFTSQVVLLVKNGNVLNQVGFVQSLNLKADIKKTHVEMLVKVPAEFNNNLPILGKRLFQLEKLGCKIERI